MLKWLMRKQLDRFEREYGYDASYTRAILDADPIALLKFSRVMGMDEYRKDVPKDAYFAAKLAGTVAEDCGPCTQLEVADTVPPLLGAVDPGYPVAPDDEPLGGRLAGIGQAIRFVGGEGLSHVLIRHLQTPNSCVLVDGPRSRCAFQPLGYPHRTGRESGLRPRNQGESPHRAVSGTGTRGA